MQICATDHVNCFEWKVKFSFFLFIPLKHLYWWHSIGSNINIQVWSGVHVSLSAQLCCHCSKKRKYQILRNSKIHASVTQVTADKLLHLKKKCKTAFSLVFSVHCILCVCVCVGFFDLCDNCWGISQTRLFPTRECSEKQRNWCQETQYSQSDLGHNKFTYISL